MTTFILCNVAFIFVLWVVLLKCELTRLKEQNRKLAALLEDKVKQQTGGVTVENGRRLTPSEAKVMERSGGGAKIRRDSRR